MTDEQWMAVVIIHSSCGGLGCNTVVSLMRGRGLTQTSLAEESYDGRQWCYCMRRRVSAADGEGACCFYRKCGGDALMQQ